MPTLSFPAPDQATLAASLVLMRTSVLGQLRERLQGSGDPRAIALARSFDTTAAGPDLDVLAATTLIQLGQELRQLRAIDAALGQLRAGRYGLCNSCSQPIAAERMRAQPMALLCLRCQERSERLVQAQ
ncbi:MAG: TraR/DksA C4-type zinc finger protein [Pseudomonadota bacterium]